MMPDIENVLKGLEQCKAGGSCDGCQYDINSSKCIFLLHADALALLKEQEAVEPKKVKGYNPPMYTFYEYECEKCKSPMMNKQPFCMGCGRPVKWE